MREEDYYDIINNAQVLDRALFRISNINNLNQLEKILHHHSEEQKEPVVAVPLVQPYGGPVTKYILLTEKQYNEIRTAMKSNKLNDVYPRVGIAYDQERIDINKNQIQNTIE